ncbi:MAG: S4 domain-containing protein [Bacteroidota bacterium]
MEPKQVQEVRIDKWLHAVRLFKTRSLAVDACAAGKIKIDDTRIKASRIVHPGDIINVQIGPMRKVVKVIGCIEKGISAPLVPKFMEDLTSPEEIERVKNIQLIPSVHRERGTGRPTKRDRRDLDRLMK